MRFVIRAAVAASLLATSPAVAQTAPSSPASAFTVSAEALTLWFKDTPTPPLVTDGLFGASGTKVLLGDRDSDTGPNPGFRITAGWAPTGRWGVETSVLYVPSRTTSRTVSSSGRSGSTDLFVPYFDVILHGENVAELSSITGSFAGTGREELRNSLLGVELNGTMRVPVSGPVRVDLLGGFRYLRFKETYTFTTSSPFIPPEPADVWLSTDEFAVTNNFYGPQVGVRASGDWGAWSLTGTVKVALGAMVQSVDIDGRLVTNDFNGFGTPETFVGGYFAQPTNIGSYRRSVFGVVPEAALSIAYRITPALSVVAGYSFLYANDVLRAPQQVNRKINPIGSPTINGDPPGLTLGPAEPSFRFRSSDFWAQGLTVGVAYRF